MSTENLKKSIQDLLMPAGIKINGPNPWDIQVHNDGFYKRVLSEGTLGLGESYMDGWWDVEKLDEFTYRVMRTNLYQKAKFGLGTTINVLLAKVFNMQAKGKAATNAQQHYDIGNKLYRFMLDKRMAY